MTNQLVGKCRIVEIDILKALAIILMVAGHSAAPFTHFIYLFHMAAFFIASGFFFKSTSSATIENAMVFIKKKIKQLWFPFVFWNTLFILLHNVFIKLNVYTDNSLLLNYVEGANISITEPMTIIDMEKSIIKSFFFGGGTQMGGAFWFLKILFITSICYCICDYFCKKFFNCNEIIIQSVLSALFLCLGFCLFQKGKLLWGLSQVASYYCLYHIGHLLSCYRDKYKNWNWKIWITMLFVSFISLLILNDVGSVDLDRNSYTNPLFLLITSILGWVILYSIAYFIKQVVWLKNVLLVIGKRTLAIVEMHFLVFKLVAFIIVCVYKMPKFCIAAFPNLYGSKGLWWLVYTVIGVAVPVVVRIMYEKVKGWVKNRIVF